MKPGRILNRLLLVLFAAGLVVSSIRLICDGIDSAAQKADYDALAAQVALSRREARSTGADVYDRVPIDAPPDPTETVLLPEYEAVYAQNPDTVGWLEIGGTCINYPVMQTPDHADFYLKRSFDGAYSAHGCLYVRESCDVFAPSDNVTIYGHHMNDGSMFAALDNYRSQSFWQEHPTIRFDTLYAHHTYTVFAVFTTTATPGEGFAFHLFEDAENEADFDAFVTQCKERSLIDTGITPLYGDKLICLSTCEYTQSNGRLVVAALRDNETADRDTLP